MLTDSFGRPHSYLRISLTDHCQFRCRYCMPMEDMHFHPQEHLMSADEIESIARTFVQLGTDKIRLTGGEPLVRKDFDDIVTRLSKLGVSLTLTTNGQLIHRYIDVLETAGIQSLNLSIDSLDPLRFFAITQRDAFHQVWSNIELLLQRGFHVKLNCVVMKNINDEEVPAFVELTRNLPVHVRFIEYMPFTGNGWNAAEVFTWHEMLELISENYLIQKLEDGPHDTAKKYQVPGHAGTFAVISTMSAPFCSTCNRMRLTADGKMKNCLFSAGETDLLGPLRQRQDIEPLIRQNILDKKAMMGGQVDNYIVTNPDKIQNRSMIAIGG